MNKEIIAYIVSKTGCIHPFRISRILALAEIRALEEENKRLTSFVYRGFDKVFYIEGIKELVEKDECFRIREGDPERGIRGCIEYICPPPRLPENVEKYLVEAITRAKELDDNELNKVVVEHPLFKKLLSS